MKQIYLDYAAATPMDPKVVEAMEPFFSRQFYNPSAIYLAGKAAGQALQNARAQIAQNLGARPAQITFTAGATEANNLAVQGIMRNFRGGEVLVSSIEHESVLEPTKLFKHRQIPVDKNGRLILEKLESMISDKTVLVSVGLVNNEIGTVQPMSEIAKILNRQKFQRNYKRSGKLGAKRANDMLPLYLHTDAAQAANYFNLHISRLGVDLLTINGGKIYGPKQSGALYVRAGTILQPLILGGGQENGLRSGTENVAGAVGLAMALELTSQKRDSESKRLLNLRKLFIDGLKKNIPSATVNGSVNHHAPHIVSVTFGGIDNERLMMELDERGVQVATGSACNASSDKPSHVLSAIGLNDQQAHSSLRFSFGRATTANDLARTLKLLGDLTSYKK